VNLCKYQKKHGDQLNIVNVMELEQLQSSPVLRHPDPQKLKAGIYPTDK